MEPESKRLSVHWRGERIGDLVEPHVDMYWWHARWEPRQCEAASAFLALVEAGEDPEVLVGDASPLRLCATAFSGDELELKAR